VAKNDEGVNIEEDMQLVDALRARKPMLAETTVYDNPPGGHTVDRRVDAKTWQPENTREQRDSWNRVWTFLDWNLDPFHDAASSPVSSFHPKGGERSRKVATGSGAGRTTHTLRTPGRGARLRLGLSRSLTARPRTVNMEGLQSQRGPVAQLGARMNGIHEVTGSTPVWSTISKSLILNG
jgi:hypothetical protein